MYCRIYTLLDTGGTHGLSIGSCQIGDLGSAMLLPGTGRKPQNIPGDQSKAQNNYPQTISNHAATLSPGLFWVLLSLAVFKAVVLRVFLGGESWQAEPWSSPGFCSNSLQRAEAISKSTRQSACPCHQQFPQLNTAVRCEESAPKVPSILS